MEHVAYPHIAQTIALLDCYYAAIGIGVDKGLAVVQDLLNGVRLRVTRSAIIGGASRHHVEHAGASQTGAGNSKATPSG